MQDKTDFSDVGKFGWKLGAVIGSGSGPTLELSAPPCNQNDMRSLMRFCILVGVVLASSTAAHTPPILPDPLRLAEAERLVEALPLEKALNNRSISYEITTAVTDDADDWLAVQHAQEQDEVVKQVFRLTVKAASHDRLAKAIEDARPELAKLYARRLTLSDLEGTRSFALTPEGSVFFELQMGNDIELRRLVKRFLYKQIFVDLPQMLQNAQESRQIMGFINSQE